MANISLPFDFSPLTVAKSSEVDANFQECRDKFNTYAVQTDVAKTITVAHTFAADILFTDALYDIGKSGATRPRDGFFSRNVTVGGLLTASAGIEINGGGGAEGRIYATATSGTIIWGRTGSSTDLVLANNAGGTVLDVPTGTLTARTAPSAASGAGLRLPHGAAPTSPVNGDIWTTSSGLFVRINGVTIGPLS